MTSYRMIEPWIIDELEKERRRREQPAQVPLYIPVPHPPREIPPGWEPDPDNPRGYRRKDDDRDGEGNRGVVIIQM